MVLPIAVFQAGTVTADTVTNALALLVSAVIVKALFLGDRLSKPETVAALAATILLPVCKPTYVLLAMLTVLIPARRFGFGNAERPAAWQLTSVTSSGEQGDAPSGHFAATTDCPVQELSNSGSQHPDMSSGGRFVAFTSWAGNLDSRDRNGKLSDVFVHDRRTGRTERISVEADGREAKVGLTLSLAHVVRFFDPAISPDGRFVVFNASPPVNGSSLNPADTYFSDWSRNPFVYDRATGSVRHRVFADLERHGREADVREPGRFEACVAAGRTAGAASHAPSRDPHDRTDGAARAANRHTT